MRDLLNQKIVLYIGIALMVIGVAGLSTDSTKSVDSNTEQTASTATTITSNSDGTVVSYEGVDGFTALELLKAGAEVVTENSSYGEYVVSINGVEQTKDTYWIYYVNYAEAVTGAADYETSNGENIEWRLEN